MKKKIYSNIKMLAALFVAGAAFTACSSSDSENIIEQPDTTSGKYQLVVEASKSIDQASTRALSLDNNTLNVYWNGGERVYVNYGGKENYIESDYSEKPYTRLHGLLPDLAPGEDDLTFYYGHTKSQYENRNYSNQLGTLNDIEANFDFCEPVTVKAGKYETPMNGYISIPGGISFGPNKQAIVKFILKNSDGSASVSVSKLDVTTSGGTYTATGSFTDGVVFLAIPGFSTPGVAVTANNGQYSKTSSTLTFSNGKYYEVTVKLNEAD